MQKLQADIPIYRSIQEKQQLGALGHMMSALIVTYYPHTIMRIMQRTGAVAGPPRTLRVGVRNGGYREERNIRSVRPDGVELVHVRDLFSSLRRVARAARIVPGDVSRLNGMFLDAGLNRVDLLHLFFTLPLSRTPWVVTFSHYLPRWNQRSAIGHRLLAGDSCRRLIAISDFARRKEEEILRLHSPEPEGVIRKIIVLHPPQSPLIRDMDEKPMTGGIVRCTFVGHEFFRKGGLELLAAFERAVGEGCPLHLTIVSSLQGGDYISGARRTDKEKALRAIARLHPRVRHIPMLPHHKVLQLWRETDVGVLTTFDDVYGYAILEAQAAGCPVITTDVNAIGEINGPETGWLIHVPRTSTRQDMRTRRGVPSHVSEAIVEGTVRAWQEISSRPELVRTKGVAALTRIQSMHNPADRSRALLDIYLSAAGLRE